MPAELSVFQKLRNESGILLMPRFPAQGSDQPRGSGQGSPAPESGQTLRRESQAAQPQDGHRKKGKTSLRSQSYDRELQRRRCKNLQRHVARFEDKNIFFCFW
jgi:hypothetical protein